MIVNLSTFLFEVVNFLALAYVLHRLLYRPLREAIDLRREANAKAQADAEKARLLAITLQEQLSAKLAAIEEERQELIRKANEQTEADRKATMAAAERAVNKRREEAARQLEGERTQALQSLHAELVQSAVALAERFLGEASSSTLQQQLAGRLVEEVQQIPEVERQRLRAELAGDDTAVVETATELNGDILERLDAAIKSMAGRTVSVSVQTRPELLGGLRLRLGGHVWDATLTGGLREAAPTSPGSGAPMNEQIELIGKEVRATLDSLHWQVRHHEVGQIVSVGDGVGRVRGAPTVRYGELLERADGLTGLAFDLRPHDVGVLFLDPSDHVSAGDELRAMGRVASVVVGEELLGRVVDALGRPLDGGKPIRSRTYEPIEREAPGVIDRQPVREPMHTGIKVVDALLPLGRGQRELILGDRATGKTSLALDAILAQRGTEVACVYAAIGLRKTNVTEVVETLRTTGVLAQTAVVAADADSPPGQQYLAPYAACTIGESFMHQGRHVLVIYDSLTNHADAYRRIALLLGRPPGREAYPPDVFYLHARLLERATRLHDRNGGGSMTALPIVTTQAGNISAYIPTNVISITDGQLFLDNHLFNEGVRPAVDVGLSVSRVGGKAQPKVLRQLASDLRLLYAQLHELESFARFGAELEPETRQRLERGRRLREALKQPRLDPLRVSHEAAILFAIREGYLDKVAVDRVVAFLNTLRQRLDEAEADLLESIERDDEIGTASAGRLRQTLESVQRAFARKDAS